MSRYTDLLASTSEGRNYLVEIANVIDDSGAPVTLRHSDIALGWATTPTDSPANTPYSSRVIQVPMVEHRLVGGEGRRFLPPSEVTISDLVLRNEDQELDVYADYDFTDATLTIRMIGEGVPGNRWALSEAGTRFVGHIARAPSISLTQVKFAVGDLREKMDHPPEVERFHGLPWAVEFTTGAYGDAGDVHDITGDCVMAAWIRTYDITTQAQVVVRKWTGGAGNRWSLLVSPVGSKLGYLRWTSEDLTPSTIDTDAAVIADDTWHFAEILYDQTNSAVKLCVDGELAGSASFTGTVTQTTHHLEVGRNFNGWIHGLSRWDGDAISKSSYRYMVLQGTEDNLSGYWKFQEGTGPTVADTVSSANFTLNGSYAWLPSLEGEAELAGQRKPIAIGQVLEAPACWVAPRATIGPIAQWHPRAVSEFVAVYNIGATATLDTAGITDLKTFLTTAPASGKYNVFLPLGLVSFFGGVPAGAVTAHVKGDAEGGYVETMAECVERLAVDFGRLTSSQVSSSDVTALAEDQPNPVGIFYEAGSEKTVLAGVDELLFPAAQHHPDRSGVLRMAQLDIAGSSVASISRDTLSGEADHLEPLFVAKRTRSQTVGWGRSWLTQNEDNVAGVLDTNPARFDQVTKEWRWATYHSAGMGSSVDGPKLPSSYATEKGAQEEAARQQGLFSVDRRSYKAALSLLSAEVSVGDTVDLSYTEEGGTVRFGLSTPRMMLVLATSEQDFVIEIWG